MKLLFYAKVLEGFGNKVLGIIQSLIPLSQVETHRTVESLNCKLRQPVNNLNTAVMLASNKEDLLDLLALRDLLWNLRIILIIPDRKSETVAMGHMLRPRFLSYADGDFNDVAAVLEKMLGHLKINTKEQKGGEADGEKNLKNKSGCLPC